MKVDFLTILEFGDQLLADEKETLLNYAAYLLSNLASGEYGPPPDDPEALEAFQEFICDSIPTDKELNDILGRLKSRRDLEESLLPAMLATIPDSDLVDYKQYERIKAWILLASTGLAIDYENAESGIIDEEDPRISCIRSASRRVRRMLLNEHNWMLHDLPDFHDEITNIDQELEDLRKDYAGLDETRYRGIGFLHVPISNYLKHRLYHLEKTRGVSSHVSRKLEPISISSTPGMADQEFDHVELQDPPKRDIPTVSKREVEGDQPTDSKYIQPIQPTTARQQPTLAMQSIQAKAIANRLAVREMRLPCDWNTLTRYERKTILTQCWPNAADYDPVDLTIVLCLLTGRPPEKLNDILNHFRSDGIDGFYFNENHVALVHNQDLPVPYLPSEASSLVENPSNLIYLTLPDELYKSIEYFSPCCDALSENIITLIHDRIVSLNNSFNTRLTINRICGDLYTRAKKYSNDTADIALICGHTALQCPGLFYYSQNSSNPAELYSKCNEELFKDAEISPSFPNAKPLKSKTGSRLIIKDILVSALFKEQEKRLIELRKSAAADPIAFHNEYMLYTYQLLTLGTGHRPVDSPFQFRSDIDLERKTIWISDKEIRSSLSARTLILPETLCQQVRWYDEHLYTLQNRLSLDNHHATHRVKNAIRSKLPYLFWISKKDTHNINPSYLKGIMAKRWPLPLNWQRHYLRSTLKALGVNGDCVNAWMGHARFGEEAMGPWSGFSMARLRETAETLENKIQYLQISPTSGFSNL